MQAAAHHISLLPDICKHQIYAFFEKKKSQIDSTYLLLIKTKNNCIMQAERVEAYFIMLCIHWRGILYHQPCHVPISKYLYDISCGLSIHYPKTQYIAGRKRRSLDHINKEKLIIRRLNLVNNLTKFFFCQDSQHSFGQFSAIYSYTNTDTE